jgi:hypothetical protein
VISGGGSGEEEEERLLARGLEDAVTCKLWALGRAASICTDFRFNLQSARGMASSEKPRTCGQPLLYLPIFSILIFSFIFV